jgi:hypothetical protein
MKNENFDLCGNLCGILNKEFDGIWLVDNLNEGTTTASCLTSTYSGYVFTFSYAKDFSVQCRYFRTRFDSQPLIISDIFFLTPIACESMGLEKVPEIFTILLKLCTKR